MATTSGTAVPRRHNDAQRHRPLPYYPSGVCLKRLVYLLYALSGFVSLGYQVAWFRIYVDRFGSTNLTFALVVCNFIGGLGAGALLSRRLCARLSERVGIRDRLRLYGVVELLVTLTVTMTLLTGLIPADAWGSFPYHESGGLYRPDLGYQLAQIGIAILCVFVPCFFMGVTFPLLCDVYRGQPGTDRFPSALYAWNTLGACSGVLASLFIFLPWLGHILMFWLLAALNGAIGLFFLARGGAPDTPRATVPDEPVERNDTALLLTCAVMSGLLAGALEGDMFKRIDFISSGNSTVMALIAFWAIVAIFLASWAVGVVRALRLSWIKAAWVAGLVIYSLTWSGESHLHRFIERLGPDQAGVASPVGQVGFHGGFLAGLEQAFLFVGVFVFPAYFCVSLLLPYVCNRIHADRRHLGVAYGLNTLAFGAGLIGFTLLAPRVSIFYSLKLLFALFAVATVLLLSLTEARRPALWKPIAAAGVFAVACFVTPRGFDTRYMVPGTLPAIHPIRAMKSNGAHTTYVVEAPRGDFLFFERHAMSGTTAPEGNYMRLMAHFPLLAQDHPTRVLLICYGVGNTASAIALHDTIEAIDVIELSEKVVETAPEFGEVMNDVHLDPRIRFIIADGRSFLRLTDGVYDLITGEPPPPMQAGVYRLYTLYTREYYETALGRLSPHGMMSQWIPSYQMPGAAAELAIRTFIEVFPHAILFTGGRRELILVGSPSPIDLRRIEARFHAQPAVAADLRGMGVNDALSLIARVLAGDAGLRRRFGRGRTLGDAHNDLDFVFHERDRPPLIDYDPYSLLADIDADRLACRNELRGVLTHLGRLRYHVPRYSIPTLTTARDMPAGPVHLADVDWMRMSLRMERFLLLRNDGRLDEACRVLEDMLDTEPRQPEVLLHLAQLELRLDRPRAALETIRSFQALEPREEIDPRLEGRALWALGRREEARSAFRRSVELDPHSPDAREAYDEAVERE